MALALEMQLHDLFKEFGDSTQVAAELTSRWEKNLLSFEEQRAAARFLIRSGQHHNFFVQVRRLLSSRQKLPWPELAFAIELSKIDLSKEELRALTEGIAEQDAYHEALEVSRVGRWDPILERKKSEKKDKLSHELLQKRQFLREKINYFKSQRMYKDEAAAIAELRSMFPDDESLPAEQRTADERWAYDIVAQGATQRDLSESLEKKLAELSNEQINLKASWLNEAKQNVKANPDSAYDLAMHLHFMEFHQEAIEVLEATGRPLQNAEVWLRLELYIKSRRFVEALDETYNLEARFSDDPEAVFAAIYSRALCLWELGQGSLAVDLLKSIVRIRPGYRSTHSLLMAWTGGDF